MTQAIRKILRIALGFPKTLIFNFKYFPLRIAWRIPVILSNRVWLRQLGGSVSVSSTRFGSVQIGFDEMAISDPMSSRTIWEVAGAVSFEGRAWINYGAKLSVRGSFIVGDQVVIGPQCAIVCYQRITIGAGSMVGWDVTIMDTDLHPVLTSAGRCINPPRPVRIEKNVWIGAKSFVSKGAILPQGCVLSATTLYSARLNETNAVIMGNPPRVVLRDIRWSRALQEPVPTIQSAVPAAIEVTQPPPC